MAFLLGSTWLALNMGVAERSLLVIAASVCEVAPAGGLLRRTTT